MVDAGDLARVIREARDDGRIGDVGLDEFDARPDSERLGLQRGPGIGVGDTPVSNWIDRAPLPNNRDASRRPSTRRVRP